MDRSHHVQGLLIFLTLVILGGLFLWQNRQPAIKSLVPSEPLTNAGGVSLADQQRTLDAQLSAARTTFPTPDMAATDFVPPTLPPTQEVVILEPTQIQGTPWPTPTPRPTEFRPTAPGPTPFPSPTGNFILSNEEIADFQPPPEEVPLSPHAFDHFWFARPVDASANSESLFNYQFGSNGPANEWRVHHGIDIPNPVGERVLAGGPGTVIFAGNALTENPTGDQDIYGAYGNVVVIKSDYGYRGQPIWLLYAHNATVLVEEGQHVEQGDVIALSGGTGDVSGPHVHLEVRIGENSYYHVYNPLLWIAPWSGYGVVAGRVTYPDGTLAEDVTVTLSQRGRIKQTTATYISAWQPDSREWHVRSDPLWQENFVMGDVPAGDYTIAVTLRGKRIEQAITVHAGTTNFVTLGVPPAATPQPATE